MRCCNPSWMGVGACRSGWSPIRHVHHQQHSKLSQDNITERITQGCEGAGTAQWIRVKGHRLRSLTIVVVHWNTVGQGTQSPCSRLCLPVFVDVCSVLGVHHTSSSWCMADSCFSSAASSCSSANSAGRLAISSRCSARAWLRTAYPLSARQQAARTPAGVTYT